MFGFRIQRHGAVTEQQAFRALFFREVLVDVHRALRPADGVHDEIVRELLHAEHVGEDVIGDPPLAFRADSPRQRDRAVLDSHEDVVDVEPVVLRQPFAHEIADLAIVELVEVLDVFVVARHLHRRAEGLRRLPLSDRREARRPP